MSRVNAKLLGREKLVVNLTKYSNDVFKGAIRESEIMQAKVVNFAKANHPYKDHTTNLTKSIQPSRVILTKDRVVAEVRAGDAFAPYASWVENGTSRSRPYPFMFPALIANQAEFKARLGEVMKGARP